MKLDGMNEPSQANSILYHDNSGLASIKHAQDQHEALKTVAGQFEAMFLQLVLRQMRSSSDVLADKDSPFSSQHEGIFRDMYDGQLAIELAKKQKAGIADMLVKQLSPDVTDSVEENKLVALSPANDDRAEKNMSTMSQNDMGNTLCRTGMVNSATEAVASVNQEKINEVNAISAFAQPLIRKTES